jgi:hypothetical protein
MSGHLAVSQLIDQTGIDALRQLLGRRLNVLFSSALSVHVTAGTTVIRAPHVSLAAAAGSWVIIDNDWSATRDENIDYHMLAVRPSAAPRDIRVGTAEFPDAVAYPHSSVTLEYLSSSLTAIGIHTHEIRRPPESVIYDRAVVFRYQDGGGFALEPQDSISGLLEVKSHPTDIRAVEGRYPCRVLIR